MRSASRRWAAGALLVGLGWLLSPTSVPVYDGLPNSDEPYRYVAPPPGATKTAPPTSVTVQTPVRNGGNAQGLSLQTQEVGPQVSAFLPQYALSARTGPLRISASPIAPADVPADLRADGNAYVFAFSAPSGPVTLNPARAAIATLYLRSTYRSAPQPTMYFRAGAGAGWQPLQTTAGGVDVRVASFKGAGQYLLLKGAQPAKGDGFPVVPVLLLGAVVLLVSVVLVVRLRAAGE